MADDYWYLCFNCGFITPYERWTFWIWSIGGPVLIEHDPDTELEAVACCPVCLYYHEEDDDSPGIMDGTHGVLTVERERIKDGWVDRWQEVSEEVFGL
jgi:hypothetical protein